MSANPGLDLLFGASVPDTVRQRITHAFRLFCAVYGFDPNRGGGAPVICYGAAGGADNHVVLHPGYLARPPGQPAPRPLRTRLGASGFPAVPGWIDFPCYHRVSDDGPDWLGEIFEWVSAAHEHAISARDDVGRISFEASLHGRDGLDPEIPYAAMAMHYLNRRIRGVAGDRWPEQPRPPWDDAYTSAVAVTHDIDFLPTSTFLTFHRLMKNVAIAALAYRDIRLAASIKWAAIKSLFGAAPPLDCLPAIIRRERESGIGSTCTVIPRRRHRRDADYSIDDQAVRRRLDDLVKQGVEIGVHGSYTSLDERGRLAAEYRLMRQAGYPAVGGRQHWLRYHGAVLFDELRDAGAWYDCTSGYATQCGFRNGACFPFPPYDFRTESAYPLIELPLVLMDTTLYTCDHTGRTWKAQCERILSAARAHGWGGISVLWHDTVFRGGQLPREIGETFWTLAAREHERWMSCKDLVERIWPRYARARLLPPGPPAPAESRS